MGFKPSYNIMDRDTHNALVNAFQTGGIAYTDDDGTVHKIADDYINGGGGGELSFTLVSVIIRYFDPDVQEPTLEVSHTGEQLIEAIDNKENILILYNIKDTYEGVSRIYPGILSYESSTSDMVIATAFDETPIRYNFNDNIWELD